MCAYVMHDTYLHEGDACASVCASPTYETLVVKCLYFMLLFLFYFSVTCR